MPISGKHIHLKKWIHGARCVIQVEVEAVIPDAEPSEPCLEPDTVRWLDDLQRFADAGDVDEITARVPGASLYLKRSA